MKNNYNKNIFIFFAFVVLTLYLIQKNLRNIEKFQESCINECDLESKLKESDSVVINVSNKLIIIERKIDRLQASLNKLEAESDKTLLKHSQLQREIDEDVAYERNMRKNNEKMFK